MKYTNTQKNKIIKYCSSYGILSSVKKFKIGETTLRRWIDPTFCEKSKQYNKEYKLKRSKIDEQFKEKQKQIRQSCTKIRNKYRYENDDEYHNNHLKRCKNYHKENKEKVLLNQQLWRGNNKEKKKMLDIQYRENNKEKIYESRIQYRENNKEKIREYRSKTCFKNQQWRFTKQYDDWRERVYIKNNHTCQQCNKTKCKIVAHHIYEGSKYPELRYDINNGVTLCSFCHKKIHYN